MYFLKNYNDLRASQKTLTDFTNYLNNNNPFDIFKLTNGRVVQGGLKEYLFRILSSSGHEYSAVLIVDPLKENAVLMDNDKTMLNTKIVCKHLATVINIIKTPPSTSLPRNHFLDSIQRKYTINNFYIGKSTEYTQDIDVDQLETALLKVGESKKDIINSIQGESNKVEKETAKGEKRMVEPKEKGVTVPELRNIEKYYRSAYGNFLGSYLFSIMSDIYKKTGIAVALPKPIVDALSSMKDLINERKNITSNNSAFARASALRTVGVILYGDPGIGKSLATDIVSKYFSNDKDVYVTHAVTGQPNIRFDVQMLGSDTINNKNVVFSPGLIPTALAQAKKERKRVVFVPVQEFNMASDESFDSIVRMVYDSGQIVLTTSDSDIEDIKKELAPLQIDTKSSDRATNIVIDLRKNDLDVLFMATGNYNYNNLITFNSAFERRFYTMNVTFDDIQNDVQYWKLYLASQVWQKLIPKEIITPIVINVFPNFMHALKGIAYEHNDRNSNNDESSPYISSSAGIDEASNLFIPPDVALRAVINIDKQVKAYVDANPNLNNDMFMNFISSIAEHQIRYAFGHRAFYLNVKKFARSVVGELVYRSVMINRDTSKVGKDIEH